MQRDKLLRLIQNQLAIHCGAMLFPLPVEELCENIVIAMEEEGMKFQKLTDEEIVEMEKQQDGSNDLYKIKARVINHARGGGGKITPVGEMLCNTFVHVLKDLYDFAETIADKETKIKLIERLRKHEDMPANLIAATKVSVK